MDVDSKRPNENTEADDTAPKSPRKSYRPPKIIEVQHPSDYEEPEEFLDNHEALLEDVQKLVASNDVIIGRDIVAGDVIYVDDEEFYIVSPKLDGKKSELCIIRNPDNTGAGFLTIPKHISKLFENAVEAYGKLANVVSCMDIELSSEDAFISSKIGKLEEGWEFEVALDEGKLDNVAFKFGDGPFNFLQNNQLDLFTREYVEAMKQQMVFSCICQLMSKESILDFLAKMKKDKSDAEDEGDEEEDENMTAKNNAIRIGETLEFVLPKHWNYEMKAKDPDGENSPPDTLGFIWDIFGPPEFASEAREAVLNTFPDCARIKLTDTEKRTADRPPVEFPRLT